jgi:hypothetical protein
MWNLTNKFETLFAAGLRGGEYVMSFVASEQLEHCSIKLFFCGIHMWSLED